MAWYGGEELRAPQPKPAVAAAQLTQASSAGAVPVARLRNGLAYPMIGLGCASGVREEHVLSAIEQGYRLLDSAAAYEWGYREDEVGRALVRSGKRKDVFVQTKIRTLPSVDVRAAVKACMERLQTDYLDSVLIHKPEGDWLASWKVLEELYREGVVRAIGATDLNEERLSKLLSIAQEPPMILQNWFEPFHQDGGGVRELCKRHGIVYQSFSLFGTQWPMMLKLPSGSPNPVRSNPVLKNIAARHNRSVPQVLLRWALQEGVASVPASRSEKHRSENLRIFDFELGEEDLRLIRALDGVSPLEALSAGADGSFPHVD